MDTRPQALARDFLNYKPEENTESSFLLSFALA
jgi:hypothetical protein